ncbi:MAG: DUF1730 domain-containing protein [Bacilli bacterium]
MKLSEIVGIFNNKNIEYVGICPFSQSYPLIQCSAINRIPQNPKSIIVCLFPYYTGEYKNRNISRYALGNDYHKIISDILGICIQELLQYFPTGNFEAFVDNSPLREIAIAKIAQLGNIGLNNQLINEKYGTYTFIGSIVTDIEIDDNSNRKIPSCLNCCTCINACPTGALTLDKFNKSICRSFITQKKGELTLSEQNEIKNGGLIWGCDICNDVCPFNKSPILSPIKEMYTNICEKINYENLSQLICDKAFEYRGLNVILRNMDILYK